ncbi:hypothetical protein BT69DRAFT_1337004 [Atractiella rhizophila]|nr:hypothetical protein BT69DRAFT_1337004 [Atractiella rhizophila]
MGFSKGLPVQFDMLRMEEKIYQLSYHVVPAKKEKEDMNDFLLQIVFAGGVDLRDINIFIEIVIVTGNGAFPIRSVRIPHKRDPKLPLIHAVLSLDAPREHGAGTNSASSLAPSLHSFTPRLLGEIFHAKTVPQPILDAADTLGTFTMLDMLEGYQCEEGVTINGDVNGSAEGFVISSRHQGKVVTYRTEDSGVKLPFTKDKRARFVLILTPTQCETTPTHYRISSPTPLSPDTRSVVTFTTVRTASLTSTNSLLVPDDYSGARKGSIPFARNAINLDFLPPPAGYQPEEGSISENNKTFMSVAGDGKLEIKYEGKKREEDKENKGTSSSGSSIKLERPSTAGGVGNKKSLSNLRGAEMQRPSTSPADKRMRKLTRTHLTLDIRPPSPGLASLSAESLTPEKTPPGFNPNAYGWEDGFQFKLKTGKMPNVE